MRSGPGYHEWQRARVVVGNDAFEVATKDGVFAHGQTDPAAVMLADALAECAGQCVVVLACGNGLPGVVAARRGASHVYLCDRQVPAADAATRSLALNSIGGAQATVMLAEGAERLPAGLVADVVTIRVVPERLPMLHLLHAARTLLRPGGRCLLAGGNHEGAKSAAKMLQQLFGNAMVRAQYAGHRLVSAVVPAELPPVPPALSSVYLDPSAVHEIPVVLQDFAFTLCTRPGVFSWEHLDEASALLGGMLDVVPGERVLDIGCGAGALGAYAAHASGTGSVCLVDADIGAVHCAQRTVARAGLTNVRVLPSDIASAVQGDTFDLVIANPPFHVGRQTDLSVPRQFIRDAYDVLDTGGRARFVANRTLPYEGVVREVFGSVSTLHDGARFKVLGAVKTR